MVSNEKKFTICVVIPTFNRKAYLKVLLNQLTAQNKNNNLSLILLTVIDGSTDGTKEMIETEFPDVHILDGPGNWWWTKCMNEGIKFAIENFNPNYFLFLNDDSQIGPEYMDTLLCAYEKGGRNCIIGSISVTENKPFRVSFSGVKKIDWIRLKKENYFKPFEKLVNIDPNGLFPTYALNGRGTFLSTETLKKLNFLNERDFPQYGSDDDLALRAWKHGIKVLISFASKIYDRTQDTSKGSALRQDSALDFFKSFFIWNSVNYIPKQIRFFYHHGIKMFIPFYFIKYILGTNYAYFFKYRKMKKSISSN
jgi:GT2 family glycosyltransferase